MLNLVPNEHWDYRLGDLLRGLIAAGSSRQSGGDSEITLPGIGRCLPIRSARAAIVLSLKALALPQGASIAVPLYCCPVVFSAIKAAGFSPCFIDVDPATYCMSAADLAAKSSKVDAVIAVHMFGNVCDLPALQKAAPRKPIIEDCAQALGSRIGDKAAGSFGEIAIFSFRSGKSISAGEGGAVHCRTSDIESSLSALISELPTPGLVDECIHVVKTYLRSLLRTRPFWGLIGNRLWSAYGKNVEFTSQAPIVLTQVYKTDLRTTIRRLPVLSSQIERQRSNADNYLRNSTVIGDSLCREMPGMFYNRLQYPLLMSTPLECEEFTLTLLKHQITAARPYKNIAVIAAEHFGYSGDCPQAERIARGVIVIPCNYTLTKADVERISTAVDRAWEEIAGRRQGAGIPSTPLSAITPPQSGRLEA
jgi:perosamine synthetase